MVRSKEDSEIENQSSRLVRWFGSYKSVTVAFSGGVDSAVVAQAAYLALRHQAIAVTAQSHSLAEGELASATRLAQTIGIQHKTIATNEFENEAYRRNGKDRCYHCKTALYERLKTVAKQHEVSQGMKPHVMVSGTNFDDLSDYRPGLVAAKEFTVRHPLAELEMSKEDVRDMARYWRLSVAEKPAAPCLASRLAYGQAVTPERLRRIDKAEQFVRGLGFEIVRVRLLAGNVARVEVESICLPDLVPATRQAISSQLTQLGFDSVEFLESGYQSGVLNQDLGSLEMPLIQIKLQG